MAIESRSHASVESYGPVSSRVQSTKGAAIVQAGDSVTGEVTAALNAIVESLTGGLTADITSQKAHVLAISAEEVTGNVSVGRDGLAYGFEGYRGTVIAGRDAAAFSWGLLDLPELSVLRDLGGWLGGHRVVRRRRRQR